MDMNQFMKDMDALFSEGKVMEVEGFLERSLQTARDEKDDYAEVSILNELVGFLRDLSKYDKSLDYGAQAIKKMQDMGMTDNIGYATTLLNVATACRAAGHLEVSLKYFEQILPIYQRHLPANDMLVASYHNNVALLYQEMGNHEEACVHLEKALEIAKQHENTENEVATTHANLGISLVRVLRTEEGIAHLKEAIRIFESMGDLGYHYSAALSGMGEAMYCKDDYNAAISYYTSAAKAIKESYGENQAYHIMLENIEAVKADLPEGYVLAETAKNTAKAEVEKNQMKEEYIEKIVAEEWAFFDKVENEGGRAGCQDDYETFSIMRRSQYMTWPKELLASYLNDLEVAKSVGENLITYKYGYMMESTSPEEFAKLKDKLPEVEPERRALIDQIVAIQVGWMEEFAKNYPRLAAQSRSIHTSEDTQWNTSAETYLRGELLTYSDDTLKMYGQFVVSLAREGKNLNAMTMENTAHLYGYDDLADAEEKLQPRCNLS